MSSPVTPYGDESVEVEQDAVSFTDAVTAEDVEDTEPTVADDAAATSASRTARP